MGDAIPEFDFSDLVTSAGFNSNEDSKESHVVVPEMAVSSSGSVIRGGFPTRVNASSNVGGGGSLRHPGPVPSRKKDPHIVHLLKRISLQSTILCIIIPLFSLFKLILAPPKPVNSLFLGFFCVYTSLSQVALFAGYHRFFSHQSFQAHIALQLVYSILGGSVGLGSVLQFASQHMAHHRHQDTERDPHSFSVYGCLFSLWGHRFFLGNRKSRKAIEECRDTILSTSKMSRGKLSTKAVVPTELIQPPNYELLVLQDKYYVQLLILTNIVIPCLVAHYCCVPYWTGIYYLGFVKMSVIQQQWLLLGTLAHIKNFPLASQPFSSIRSALNLPLSFLFQFLLFGEANHNFHHEFPSDFTDGSRWYHWDPAKWTIYLCQGLGFINHLHITDPQQSMKCLIQQQQKLLDEEHSKLKWGVSIDRLPSMTSEQFVKLAIEQFAENKRALVVIEGIVHDVTPFIRDHPGGTALVQLSIGKDATHAFNGAVYYHSKAARNLLATMRIAKLSSNERVQNTVWERRMLKDSHDQQRRNNRQITYTQKNHYAAGAA